MDFTKRELEVMELALRVLQSVVVHTKTDEQKIGTKKINFNGQVLYDVGLDLASYIVHKELPTSDECGNLDEKIWKEALARKVEA